MNKRFTIATLGSHSALQILKGAHDEGFKTLLISTPDRISFYKRFLFIDEIVEVLSFTEISQVDAKLAEKNVIIIPHGSFVAYLGINGNKKVSQPYFGSKSVLEWEADRDKQREWLSAAGLTLPNQGHTVDGLSFPVIIKTFGAAGGTGYVLASDEEEYGHRMRQFQNQKFLIQEYIVGVTCYLQYFYSPLTKQLELLGIDRRYETNVDGIGRLPYSERVFEPSYVVVGNSPLVVRESLLPRIYEMGDAVITASQKLIDAQGLYGPFCLETIITPDQQFHVIEISTRIVAGTNLFIEGSPYSALYYNEPMSMGRRIAREIKIAIKQNKLNNVLS